MAVTFREQRSASSASVDKTGLLWFLALTFIPTYLVEFYLLATGHSFIGIPDAAAQFTVAGVMFFPGIAAFIVRKFITHEGFKDAGLRWGKPKDYLLTLATIVAAFIIVNILTALIVQKPDFTLRQFTSQYGLQLPMPASQLLLVLLLASITVAAIVNSIPAFGEEFGWRGYLLPKLLPLGTKKALIISGIIWGLWHAPLFFMGYKYGASSWLGILFFTVLVTFVGVYFGYLRLNSGSVFLAAFAHGAFNGQAYGIWNIIFANVNPFVGGITGILGIAVFFLLALWVFYVPLRNLSTSRQPISVRK